MAANSQSRFDYVAHVQKADGSITELAGTKEDWSVNHVYQWLWEKAHDLGGWLLADSITEAGQADPQTAVADPSAGTYQQKEEAVIEEGPRIGDAMYWGTFDGKRYSGASRISFKEK